MYSSDKKKTIDAILGPEEHEEKNPPHSSGHEALHAIAEELIDAVHAKDPKAVADCLKAAFQECDAEPHVEGEHEEEED